MSSEFDPFNSPLDEILGLPSDIRQPEPRRPQERAINALDVASGTNPDEYADQIKTAEDLGVPRETAEAAPDEAKAAQNRSALDVLLGPAPATQRYLENTHTSRVAQDSVESLTYLEGLSNSLSRSVLNIQQTFRQAQAEEDLQDFRDAGRTFGEILETYNPAPDRFYIPGPVELTQSLFRYAASRVGDPEEQRRGFLANMTTVGEIMDERATFGMSDVSRKWASGVEEADGFLNKVAAAVSDPLGMSAFAAEVGLESVPQLLLAGGVTLATRSPAAGAATSGALSFTQERFRSPADFIEAAGVDLTDPEQVNNLIFNEDLMRAAQGYGFTRGSIIGSIDTLSGGLAGKALADNPLGDLMLQTALQGFLGGTGEAAAQGATEGWENIDLNEVIFEAVGEFATTPIEVAGVGGRPLLSMLRDAHKTARAEAAVSTMEDMVTALEESPLTERSPVDAAEHMGQVLEDKGIEQIGISMDAFTEVEGVNLQELYENLGVTEQVADMTEFGGDIQVGAREFSQYVLQDREVFNRVKDHIRMQQEDLTVAESASLDEETSETLGEAEATIAEAQTDETVAQEAEAQAQQEVVSRDTTEDIDPQTEAMAEVAEREAGFAAMFATAKDAGLTEKSYASYLEAIGKAREETRRALKRRRFRRLQKRLEKQYQERRESFRPEVEERIRDEPQFQALFAIGRDRLNYNAVLDIFQGNVEAMKRLPKVDGRRIYAPKGEAGIDPHMHADIWGLDGGDVFLFNLLDNPTFEQRVDNELDRRVEAEFPTQITTMAQVDEALQALHQPSQIGTMLTFELARVRQMQGKKKIKGAVLRARARKILAGYRVGEINPRQFEIIQRREARRAARAIRAGDLDTAAQAKTNQIIAHEMTREAYKVRRILERDNKFMRKWARVRKRKRGKVKGLPVDHLDAAQDILRGYDMSRRSPSEKRLQRAMDEKPNPRKLGESLKAWAARKREEEGIVMHIGPTVQHTDGRVNWENLTLDEWRDVVNTVKDIVDAGFKQDKVRREAEKRGLQEIANEISLGVAENVSPISNPLGDPSVTSPTPVRRARILIDKFDEAVSSFGLNVATTLLSADSILRMIDGFQSLGTAYSYIKGGIDRAFSEGYRSDQVGYMRRMKAESQKLNELFDTFTKTERNTMWIQYNIPGVRQRLSRGQMISVALNMGNAGNIQALIDSGEFSQVELQNVVDALTKKELDFVQGIWDFLASFEGEVVETVRRRQNRSPEMVTPTPLETKFGSYRGGYYPLKYDTQKSLRERAITEDFDFEEARDMMLRGGFTSSHTADGHTQSRTTSGERAVRLDPFVLNQHLHQLVYDLEMGDAINDAYKALHHKTVKKAFEDAGKPQLWEALDLWLGDTITGEIHRGGLVEGMARHIRTGTTISKLGFNIVTAALQPLGVIQSGVQIGKRNVALGFFDLLGATNKGQHAWKSPLQVAQEVNEMSPMMAERQAAFNKDILDAKRGLQNGLLKRVTPGNTAEYIADSFFYLITTMQRFVDLVTWLGARRQAQQMFPDDPARQIQHADRMVIRTQGSGNFQERTNFERGTLSKGVRNTEMVRAWSLFLSYFAAKMNVAWERTKKVDIRKNPMEIITYPADMVMLFFVEGFLAGLIREGFDEDDEPEDIAGTFVWEGVKTFSAGVPIIRETVSAAEGFNTGGALGSFYSSVAQMGEQVGQGELDASLLKSVNNVAGVLFKYPTSQINKSAQAIWEDTPWDDIGWTNYITGVPVD